MDICLSNVYQNQYAIDMTLTQTYRSRLYELGSNRRGVVTPAKAEAAGVPTVELRKLAHRGALEKIGRGVYRIPFFDCDAYSDAIEALELVGSDSYLIGESVLSMLDIGVFNPRKIEVASPHRVRRQLPIFIALTDQQHSLDITITSYQGVECESVFDALNRVRSGTLRERMLSAIDESFGMRLISRQQKNRLRDSIESPTSKDQLKNDDESK